MNNKIDFVIAWVDGNDPEWQKSRNKYNTSVGDSRDIRFRDWGMLKYWFRAVEKYAPWVNNIYFVTYGHLPEFLNINHPKIKIIKHEDFIPRKYLPTFSSHTIELNLHRIKGLSEQFVYFNDDMFLNNAVKPTDFFKNGLPCDSAILSPAIMDKKDGIGIVELNNLAIINTIFDKNNQMKKNILKWFNLKYSFSDQIKNIILQPWNSFTGFYEFHIPTALLRSTYEILWKKEFDVLNGTCMHKFRDLKQDVNQWLFRDYQLASCNFNPRKTKIGKLYTLTDETKIKNIINNKYKLICINDDESITKEGFTRIKNELLIAFDKKYPALSAFEKKVVEK